MKPNRSQQANQPPTQRNDNQSLGGYDEDREDWDDDGGFEEELEINDCSACGRTYDDADADFLICHHCGWDAERKIYVKANPERTDGSL